MMHLTAGLVEQVTRYVNVSCFRLLPVHDVSLDDTTKRQRFHPKKTINTTKLTTTTTLATITTLYTDHDKRN